MRAEKFNKEKFTEIDEIRTTRVGEMSAANANEINDTKVDEMDAAKIDEMSAVNANEIYDTKVDEMDAVKINEMHTENERMGEISSAEVNEIVTAKADETRIENDEGMSSVGRGVVVEKSPGKRLKLDPRLLNYSTSSSSDDSSLLDEDGEQYFELYKNSNDEVENHDYQSSQSPQTSKDNMKPRCMKEWDVDLYASDGNSTVLLSDETDSHDTESVIDDDEEAKGLTKRIMVLGCNNTTKQIFDKKDSCYFCSKLILSICLTRHLLNIHRNEKEVIELQQMKKNSIEKKHACQKLRNKGNFAYNASVLENGGNLIVVQRPLKTIDITNRLNKYSSCNKCFGYYTTSIISRHNCPSDPCKKYKTEHTKLQVIGLSQELNVFFSRMKNDNVTETAANDSLIKQFVTQLLLNKGMRNFVTLSEKVRCLSTFLMDCRQHTGKRELSLQELLKPENLDDIRIVILKKFEYNCVNEKTSSNVTVQKPSTLIKLGQCLLQITEPLLRHYMKQNEKENISQTENMIKLLNAELRPLMSNAHLTLKSASAGRPEELPAADDLSTLIDYVLKIIENFRKIDERQLKYAAMTFLIMYNKRRSTEVSTLTKMVWEERHIWKERAIADLQTRKLIDPKERKFLNETELVYIRGKGGRFVPILFPKKIVPVIDLLASRVDKYIFANQAGMYIRGNDAMRNVVKKAGLSQGCISSTKFRKHAATSLQLEDLHENDFRMLCRHLGHTTEVHNRWYRLSDVTIELTKVGKILDNHFNEVKSNRRRDQKTKSGRKISSGGKKQSRS